MRDPARSGSLHRAGRQLKQLVMLVLLHQLMMLVLLQQVVLMSLQQLVRDHRDTEDPRG